MSTTIDRFSIMWKSELCDKTKWYLSKIVVLLVLQYGCTIWTLTKILKKEPVGKYKQCCVLFRNVTDAAPVRHLISFRVRWIAHIELCCRRKDKLISNVYLWSSTHGHTSYEWPAKTSICQFCADTRWSLEDLPRARDNSDGWWESERVREFRAITNT